MSTGRSVAAAGLLGVVSLAALRYRRAMLARIGITLLVGMSVGLGCGGDISPKMLNEPCTRTEQCVEGLVCLSGVCLVPDESDDSAGAIIRDR